MRLKEVIISRHANFNAGEEVGISESEALAERLVPFVNPESMIIVTSTVKRAWLTAKPICRKFGLRHYAESEILRWLEKEDVVKGPQTLALIEEYEEVAETLLIITHLDCLDWLPAAVAEKYLKIGFTGGNQGYARGWAINLETRTIEPI